ncbi:MAG TPA: dolichyl-phosphate beta-glucosyltransferase [Gaiellaceae bacterium]|nr:dolichyl-phosphate beta-glucosyltransferase [Gaiellaceae bacterium]
MTGGQGESVRTLAIVVPAYNEEGRLGGLFETLERDADRVASAAGLRLAEVIVVDDGSTDGTAALLDGYGGLDGRLRVVHLGRNQGKGAAVREGMLGANTDFALVTDVDLSTPLDDLATLVGADGEGVDAAIGSRALRSSRVLVRQPAYRELMGKAFNLALRILTRLPYRDTQCGFKLFRLETTRVLFERQRVRGFAYDAEICVLAREHGLRVVEVPVRWSNHPDTRVKLIASSTRMGLDLLRIARLARRRRR